MKYKDKFKVVTRLEIEDTDFNDIVQEVYGVNFHVEADLEASNYSSYDFETTEMDKWDKERLEKFKRGTYYYSTGSIIKDLASRGLIPRGVITIKVSW